MLHLNKKIILASASPRRQALLALMDLPFKVRSIEVDESYPDDLPIDQIAAYLARKKSEAYPLFENELLITADTVVAVDGQILGKPITQTDAMSMLEQQVGKSQSVFTGVCLRSESRIHVFTAQTQVHFKKLTTDELHYYVDRYQPFDKAGAYGIQEWLGAIGIGRIDGSYHNVMGLPTEQLYDALKMFKE